jgi:hypothetical protein
MMRVCMRMQGEAALAVVGVMCASAIVSVACFNDSGPGPKPVSNWSIADARDFSEFPLYWLGYSYDGLPLTTVRLTTDGDDITHAAFAYGEPRTAVEGIFGKFWVPQVEVDIQPYCGLAPGTPVVRAWD